MDKEDSRNESIEVIQEERIRYPVHTAPNPLLWPVFALQYLLLVIPFILASAVLLADQIGAGHLPNVRSELFSLGLLTSGTSTLIQILFGSRLPTLEGMNTVYIIVISSIVRSSNLKGDTPQNTDVSNTTESSTEPWKLKMAELQGNLLLASATHFMLGVTGITGFLLRFIGPVTLAPTIMLVGVTLSEYMIPLCEHHWGIATLSLALVVIFSLMLAKVNVPIPVYDSKNKFSIVRYPLFQLNAVMLAIGLSWMFSYVLTVTNVLPSNSTMYGHMARTDVRNNVIDMTPWFYLPRPFPFGTPTFSASGYVGMLTVNFITIMELIGGYFGIAQVTDTVPPPVHAVNRGTTINGLSCAICSVFGNVLGNVPHLTLLGCMAITKIVSRAVFLTGACILIIMGVVGKIGAALTLLPDPVLGGVNLVGTSMLASVGISLLRHANLSSTRNLMIIGLCVALGLTVPGWMNRHTDIIKTGNAEIDQVLTVMLSTPMCITGLLGSLLDNIIPGTQEERGIAKWRQSKTGSTEIYTTGADIYEFPYISKFLSKVKCCVYCPISPTFDNYKECLSCNKSSQEEISDPSVEKN